MRARRGPVTHPSAWMTRFPSIQAKDARTARTSAPPVRVVRSSYFTVTFTRTHTPHCAYAYT